jgi:hypothetical protein
MATPVAQSFSSLIDSASTTSRNVNLPTGLQEGNLMILHISGGNFSNNPNTPSGWTEFFRETNAGGSSPFGHILCYKIATAGDVSAGTVTITSDNTTVRASVTRITGNYLLGNFTSQRDTGSTTSRSISHPSGISVGNLLLLGVIQNSSSGTGSITLPTGWTSGIYTVSPGGAGNDRAVLLAYKTAVSGDIAGSTTVETTSAVFNRMILDIQQVANDSGNATFFETEPTFFVNATSLSAPGEAIFFETEPVFLDNDGGVVNNTNWTNTIKPTSTWSNENKNE